MKGGLRYGWCTVHRCAVPPDGIPGCDQRGAWRGNPARRASFPSLKTAPCRLRRIGCSSSRPQAYALQVVQGRLFGMGQSTAHQWIHVLLPALQAALRTHGDTPDRSLAALAQRLGVSEGAAAAAAMKSALPTRRHIPCPREVGWCRLWVSWPSRCPRWRSSCQPRNPGARN